MGLGLGPRIRRFVDSKVREKGEGVDSKKQNNSFMIVKYLPFQDYSNFHDGQHCGEQHLLMKCIKCFYNQSEILALHKLGMKTYPTVK